MLEASTLTPASTLEDLTHSPPILSIQRILVPTDRTPESLAALCYANALGQQHGAEVLLLHVYERTREMEWSHEPGSTAPSESDLEHFEGLRSRLLPNASLAFAEGDLVSEIIRFARESQADLIILGSHGYKGLAYSMKGSVAEKVMRYASCPVLCVKSDAPHLSNEALVQA